MDSKYSPLDHGGMEAVERNDAPEVVPNSSPFPIDRKSTLFNPEPVVSPPYHTKEEHGNYYLGDNGSDSAAQTPYSDLGKPAYFNTNIEEVGDQSGQTHGRREGRRYCGMRKAIFIAVLVAVVLLVCVAAILGGVLGVVLPKKNAEYVAG